MLSGHSVGTREPWAEPEGLGCQAMAAQARVPYTRDPHLQMLPERLSPGPWAE